MNQRYIKSEKSFEEAKKIIPRGITSARCPRKFVPGKYPIFINRRKGGEPSFLDGYKVQEVMEAVQISAREKRWVTSDEL